MRISLGAVALTALVGGCAIVPPEPAKEHGRQLVWQEEFDGQSFAETKFRFRATMNSNDCLYSNVVETAEVKDGKLCLHVLPSPDPKNYCMLSRGIATHDTMGFKYGYLEMRAKVPFKHGAWPSFWMTVPSQLRKCPWMSEVDIFEVFSSTNTVVSNLHKWGRDSATKKSVHVMLPGGEGSHGRTRSYAFPNAETLNDEFHVYGFEWTPKEMSFYVDGKKYTSYPIDEASDYAPNKHVPGMAGHHDFHSVIFNNEVFTPGHGWCPEPWTLKPEDLPIHYEIDWVRLWQDPAKEELKVF